MAWTDVTYNTGWISYSDANYSPVSYMKTSNGVVTVRGACSRAAGGSGTMFTLPAGFRPGKNLLYWLYQSGAAIAGVRVDVNQGGSVVIVDTTSVIAYQSCVFSFMADQ